VDRKKKKVVTEVFVFRDIGKVQRGSFGAEKREERGVEDTLNFS